MTKAERLQEIIKCCETRFNRGEAATWKHGDFIDLHTEIQRDTNTNISPSTLKRIFGKVSVDEEYIPQQATLDALKIYGQYTEVEIIQNVQPIPTLTIPAEKKNIFRQWKLVTLIAIISIVVVGLLTWQFWKPATISGKINLVRIEGHLPATAFFTLQLPDTGDSLFVNFGDKSPWLYIRPGEKSTAHIYYFPGVFNVSVQTRQQTITTTTAYIKSDSWIAFGCHRQDDIPMHFYAFPAAKTSSDSLLHFTNTALSRMGLDTTGPVLTRLSNYTPLPQTADDFIFETSFKNALPEKGIYCRSTQFQISGSNSMIRFKWVNAGCSQRVLNVLSEQTFKGSANDLSQFVLDLSQWNTVKLVNHNKQVTLSVNGKEIFTGAYQQSLGDIRGLFLEFEGTGAVKNCDLKTYDGKMLYHF